MWPIECSNIILWWYIGYREMLVNLVLLDLWHFNVILGMDWLASYHASVDCFGKMVMFHIFCQLKFSFEGKHVDIPLHMISTLQTSYLLDKEGLSMLFGICGEWWKWFKVREHIHCKELSFCLSRLFA